MGRLLDARTKGVPYKCSIKVYEWGERGELQGGTCSALD